MKKGKKKLAKKKLYTIGSVCFLVNGVIFLLYAILVPTYMRSVHGLITLTALLFGVAALPLYNALRGLHEVGSKMAAVLIEIAVIVFIASDILLTAGAISAFYHAVAYVAGNLLFIIGVLTSGTIMLKGFFYRWVGYLSLVTGLVGLITNIPPPSTMLTTAALFLLGLWSLAVGYNLHQLRK